MYLTLLDRTLKNDYDGKILCYVYFNIFVFSLAGSQSICDKEKYMSTCDKEKYMSTWSQSI